MDISILYATIFEDIHSPNRFQVVYSLNMSPDRDTAIRKIKEAGFNVMYSGEKLFNGDNTAPESLAERIDLFLEKANRSGDIDLDKLSLLIPRDLES